MGAAKRMMEDRWDMQVVAQDVAVAAGLGKWCDLHSDEFICEFPFDDLLVEAYKIGNARITRGEIDVPGWLGRRGFTDTIKHVATMAPGRCTECERLFVQD